MPRGGLWRAAAFWLVLAGGGQAADRTEPAGLPGDIMVPTVPRGFAADLPRSPLVDAIVDAGLRFRSAGEARRRCPGDDIVRIEPFSTVYKPAEGAAPAVFMCKAAALQEGDLPR